MKSPILLSGTLVEKASTIFRVGSSGSLGKDFFYFVNNSCHLLNTWHKLNVHKMFSRTSSFVHIYVQFTVRVYGAVGVYIMLKGKLCRATLIKIISIHLDASFLDGSRS